ncbi:hypothetical protein CIW60_09670 [Enterobacter roggenkampii]|uniref:hypothetical protein n=1 Tax=Enterobacter roggenkampii TaxID=1812935 RepID=UPI000BA83BE4|nr:hypothetical protein [Enterobacter roggenkampii]PAO10846.1 hypothetical protein CIW60_09670 [Enterobacter roggenkampii]QAZ61650.1 hypothetical protein C3B80_03700 [Enterobacter cloacae]WFC79325.1 hypothetical protein OM095_05385 [Enterobacter roggenkampii]
MMKLDNLSTLIHDEAKKLAKTKSEPEISHYDMLLRDVIALSLSLRHQKSTTMRIAGNKMLRNLQLILKEGSDLHTAISELHHDAGESMTKDKHVIDRIYPHIEFLDLCRLQK